MGEGVVRALRLRRFPAGLPGDETAQPLLLSAGGGVGGGGAAGTAGGVGTAWASLTDWIAQFRSQRSSPVRSTRAQLTVTIWPGRSVVAWSNEAWIMSMPSGASGSDVFRRRSGSPLPSGAIRTNSPVTTISR